MRPSDVEHMAQRWHRFGRGDGGVRVVDLSRVMAYDPDFDGGTMLRMEGNVGLWVSNTGEEVAEALGLESGAQ